MGSNGPYDKTTITLFRFPVEHFLLQGKREKFMNETTVRAMHPLVLWVNVIRHNLR